MAKEKDHELLWQTRRRDPNCNSGGRLAAATVMTTTCIPTRSGDGTFVLEFVPSQYTLFLSFFGACTRIILDTGLTLGPAGVCDFGCPGSRDELAWADSERQIRLVLTYWPQVCGTPRLGITQLLQKPSATRASFGFMSTLGHDKTFSQPINWTTSLFMLAFHVGAIAALFFFTWKALAIGVVLWWVAGSLGIGMGYHRLLTHRGYKTPKWMEHFLTVCGTLALEGGPIAWVATHRVHHQNTDKEGDPHSPQDGGLWAHMGWILTGQAMHSNAKELLPFVPDLRKDKFHLWITKWHWVPLTVLGIALFAIGGWPFLLWGVFLRTVVGLHATWLVNSATHMWGSRRFLTDDTSKNSLWVALLTFGEGWHNNHHAVPQSARHGITWYEIDMNWYGICVLRALGLARDVKRHKLVPQEAAERHAVITPDATRAPAPVALPSGD
jgi:fatty-acid desaturase